MISTELIRKARSIIDEAQALLIVAGAGMGVDSGLPDYRGSAGLYQSYPPFARLGNNYIDMMKLSGLEQDPCLAWGYWGYLLNLFRTTQPHEGFRILLSFGKRKANNYFVQTTNIDGQFQKAGFSAERIHECHGSLHRLQCFCPCSDTAWSSDTLDLTINPKTMRVEAPLPRCPRCGSLARPNVFMFGDTKYNWDIPQGHADRYRAWLAENHDRTMAIIECGAGTVVSGLRRHCEELAREYPHAHLIRINPHEPEIPNKQNCLAIPLGALRGLTLISNTGE